MQHCILAQALQFRLRDRSACRVRYALRFYPVCARPLPFSTMAEATAREGERTGEIPGHVPELLLDGSVELVHGARVEQHYLALPLSAERQPQRLLSLAREAKTRGEGAVVGLIDDLPASSRTFVLRQPVRALDV
jgi:hypothetical protein